jgi:aldehyde dehydrogenase (NAD+)
MTLPAPTPLTEISGIVSQARAAFESGRTRPLAWRAGILGKLRSALRERADELVEAAVADFGKPVFEAWATEIGYTIAELDHVHARMATWARRRRVPTPLIFQPGSSHVVAEPLGLTCVISTWNYPVQLLVMPMIAAISAGNAVIGKPSELTPNTSAALARLFGELGDPAVALVQGGSVEGAELLTHRFDHILYTGSVAVARTVLRAAAEHLTPVTLELGGKSPAIVSRHADISMAARRIAWGKFFNAGQTCIAPDYVLVENAVHDDLVDALRASIRQFFGDNPQASPDLARIVSEHHFHRLGKLLHDGTAVAGGITDAATLYVAPTILTGVTHDDPVMQEEIFGPILPVLPVSSLPAAADIVRARDKPLALYIFSRRKREAADIIRRVTSGGVCVNGTLLHVGNPYLPFGGVGQSGMGHYHGKYGFDAFSHLRAVYTRSGRIDPAATYPPYTAAKEQLLRLSFAFPDPRNVAARLRHRMRPARPTPHDR